MKNVQHPLKEDFTPYKLLLLRFCYIKQWAIPCFTDV